MEGYSSVRIFGISPRKINFFFLKKRTKLGLTDLSELNDMNAKKKY